MDNSNANNGGTSFGPGQLPNSGQYPPMNNQNFEQVPPATPVSPVSPMNGEQTSTFNNGNYSQNQVIPNDNAPHYGRHINARHFGHRKDNYMNVQTQSLIESPRDANAQDLERARLYQEQVERTARQAEMKEGAKRTGTFAAIAAFVLVLVVAAGFLVFAIINSTRGRADLIIGDEQEQKQELSKVEGYDCKTNLCGKITDLPDGRILLRDDSYYIYNEEDESLVLTTIENQTYTSISPFVWNGKTYAILDPATDKSAIFSITNNRKMTDYDYDLVFTDPKAPEYAVMKNMPSDYILVKTNSPSNYAVIDLIAGRKIVQGAKAAIYYDGYCFGIKENNAINAYLPGNSAAYLVGKPSDEFYIYKSLLIHAEITSADSVNLMYWNKQGQYAQSQQEYALQDEVRRIVGYESNKQIGIIRKQTDKFHKIAIPSDK